MVKLRAEVTSGEKRGSAWIRPEGTLSAGDVLLFDAGGASVRVFSLIHQQTVYT